MSTKPVRGTTVMDIAWHEHDRFDTSAISDRPLTIRSMCAKDPIDGYRSDMAIEQLISEDG